MAYDIILQRIKSITKQDIYSWCDEYITTHKSELVKLVQERLKRGQNVHNTSDVIAEYKSQAYAMFKQRMNPLAGGSVDLFLTGDLQRFLTIEKQSTNQFKIYSKDEKYKMLGNKYGFEQFGLTKEQHEELTYELLLNVYNKIFEKILK